MRPVQTLDLSLSKWQTPYTPCSQQKWASCRPPRAGAALSGDPPMTPQDRTSQERQRGSGKMAGADRHTDVHQRPPCRGPPDLPTWKHLVIMTESKFLQGPAKPQMVTYLSGARVAPRILACKSSAQMSVGVKFKNCVEVLLP